MSSIRRLASQWICEFLFGALPERQKVWAQALRAEVDNVPDDSAALLFALDALRGIALFSLSRLLFAGVAVVAPPFASLHSRKVSMVNKTLRNISPRSVGIACAIGAVLLGLAYLFTAGAPVRLIAVNAAALILGLTTVAILTQLSISAVHGKGIAMLLMSFALLATALSGSAVNGASRWVAIGPLAVQPSLVLLPMMVLMFARDRSPTATVGILIAALAMAMQPDRAMAGVLMCGLAALAIARGDRYVLIALTASVCTFTATMAHPDQLPSAPYVDQILYTSFDVNLWAGVSVTVGAALLLVPALHGLRFKSVDRTMCVVFGIVWFSAILAAALGNYPTPVVGYGGSAILGYLLSLGALLGSANSQTAAHASVRSLTTSQSRDHHLPFASCQFA